MGCPCLGQGRHWAMGMRDTVRQSSIHNSAIPNPQSTNPNQRSALINPQSAMKKPASSTMKRALRILPAVTYSPTQFPTQYHRR
jgi:hypothetical protein